MLCTADLVIVVEIFSTSQDKFIILRTLKVRSLIITLNIIMCTVYVIHLLKKLFKWNNILFEWM